jgi:hypothetical protein
LQRILSWRKCIRPSISYISSVIKFFSFVVLSYWSFSCHNNKTKIHHFCVSGCGGIETAQHLFLCGTFGSLWALLRSWIGFSTVDAYSLTDHFVQFTFSASGLRARRSFMQLVWLACVWVVWNERNLRVFSNSENIVHQLLDKVKLFSYRWLQTSDVTLATNFHR